MREGGYRLSDFGPPFGSVIYYVCNKHLIHLNIYMHLKCINIIIADIYIAIKVIWISKNRENNQTLQRHQHKIKLKFSRNGSANHQTGHRYSYSIIILLPHVHIIHH